MVEDALAHSPPKAELERKFDQLPDDLKKAAKPILKELKKRATTANESELYDMALMLLFMDLHGESAKLIENRRLSSRLDWLLLEVLILGRQYASALGEVENLELKYAGDPETPFALTYARARFGARRYRHRHRTDAKPHSSSTLLSLSLHPASAMD